MKTWQAALAHLAITAAQAALAVPFFDNNSSAGALGNVGVQIGAQFALSALQVWAAKVNSNTDPRGKPLVAVGSESYKTAA